MTNSPHYYAHHYNDVTMSKIASHITSLTIVYSTVYSGADQTKHQSSASLAFVRGIHRGPVNSPHKWPVTRKKFPFDDVIMFIGKNMEISSSNHRVQFWFMFCLSHCSAVWNIEIHGMLNIVITHPTVTIVSKLLLNIDNYHSTNEAHGCFLAICNHNESDIINSKTE